MINEMWKKYEADYLDEFDELAAYENFFVEYVYLCTTFYHQYPGKFL